MPDSRQWYIHVMLTAVATSALTACRSAPGPPTSASQTTLRVGVGQLPSSPADGLRALAQTLTLESLARLTDEGRPAPSLARDWTVSSDGRSLVVNLLSGVKFHDGSPMTAAVVADALKSTLPTTMGPAFEDVESVSASRDDQVVVRLRRASPFLLDSLETVVPKPGAPLVGTGPYVVSDPKSLTEMHANADYYLGRPSIDRVVVERFPSVRGAWAEMLRGRLDMLYEVGIDALDSLEASNSISIFTFTRRYQYVVVLNEEADVFRSAAVRRALNTAIDRDVLVRDALDGHGVASSGPVWPHNYAFRSDSPKLRFDPKAAAALLSGKRPTGAVNLHFSCLVAPNPVNERLALAVKNQLQAVGVDVELEEASMDRVIDAVKKRTFQAALLELVSGPTLLRPYQMWHSNGFLNVRNPAVDAALDRVRYAASTGDYQNAVASFQQATVDNPPAIFLAWSERARAVSKGFAVPQPEPGRDVLSNLRLWKPATEQQRASRN